MRAFLLGLLLCAPALLADIAPPPSDPSNPITLAAAGVALSLGIAFLGWRYAKRRQSAARK